MMVLDVLFPKRYQDGSNLHGHHFRRQWWKGREKAIVQRVENLTNNKRCTRRVIGRKVMNSYAGDLKVTSLQFRFANLGAHLAGCRVQAADWICRQSLEYISLCDGNPDCLVQMRIGHDRIDKVCWEKGPKQGKRGLEKTFCGIQNLVSDKLNGYL